MDRFQAFLDMGGYAMFVWPAYAIAIGVLIGLLVVSLRGMRGHEEALRSLRSKLPHRARVSGGSGDDA